MMKMKFLPVLFLFSISFLGHADTNSKIYNRDHPIKTNKLSITGFEPNNWLKFYEHQLNRGQENIIPLIASFNLDNVRSVIITDKNAEENICGQKQPRALLLLSFKKPDNNIKKVQTFINKPCFKKNKAVFRLTVQTDDGKYYNNTTTLTAAKNAFGLLHHVNYGEKRKPYIPKTNQDKLEFKIIAQEDSPDAWAIFNDEPYPGKATTVPISIKIDIQNIEKIKIDDINAYNYKCNINNPINLLNLSFTNPATDKIQLNTNIPSPCFYKDKAKLELSVITKNGEKYYKVINIPVDTVN